MLFDAGSSFEQIILGPSPQNYVPSFMEIDRLVPEKNFFEGILPSISMIAILII